MNVYVLIYEGKIYFILIEEVFDFVFNVLLILILKLKNRREVKIGFGVFNYDLNLKGELIVLL